jgi:hypothetical protein
LLTLLGQNSLVYSQCPTVTNVNQSFCDTQSPTIASLQAVDNGGGIRWYATATSTTALSASAVLVNGEDYFADDNTGSCGVRQSVTVTIYSAQTVANYQGVCVTNLNQATPSNPQFFIVGNNAVHRIVCRDKKPGVQVCLNQNGQVGQGIFPRKLPSEQEGQRKRPGKDNSPTNQKTFRVNGMYCGFSLHDVEIRRLKYAPELVP